MLKIDDHRLTYQPQFYPNMILNSRMTPPSRKKKRRLKMRSPVILIGSMAVVSIIGVISCQSFLKTESIDLESLIKDRTNETSTAQEGGLVKDRTNKTSIAQEVERIQEVTKTVTVDARQHDESPPKTNVLAYPDREGGAFLTMYGAHRVQPSMQRLPKWLQDYIMWHREQTKTDESSNSTANEDNAAKYLVLTCLDSDRCGGLSDRLRALPFFLLVGNITRRAVCIYWTKPYGLEEFLEPPPGGIDWRCPPEVGSTLKRDKKSRQQDIPYRQFGYDRGHPSMVHSAEKTLNELKELDGERFVLAGLHTQDFVKINNLNNIFQAHSYKEKMPQISSWQHVELMEHIFRVMFQPVEDVSRQVNATMSHLGLKENEFTSVHIRARYPTNRLKVLARKINSKAFDRNDKHGGLEFTGGIKDYIVRIAENAVTCAKRLGEKNGAETVFISSDSTDLVSHATTYGLKVEGMDSNLKPLSLNRTDEILHMEGGNTTARHMDFFPIIEDLLVMGAGKCVVHGIGSFGAFAAGIGGNRCRDVHRNYSGKSEACPNGRANRVGVTIKKGDLLFGQEPGDEGTLEYGEDILVDTKGR